MRSCGSKGTEGFVKYKNVTTRRGEKIAKECLFVSNVAAAVPNTDSDVLRKRTRLRGVQDSEIKSKEWGCVSVEERGIVTVNWRMIGSPIDHSSLRRRDKIHFIFCI